MRLPGDKTLWASAGLLVFAFLLFSNGFQNRLLKYDDWWIVRHERMEGWLSLQGLRQTFFDFSKEARLDHGAEYLPVRDLSAAFQAKVFGANPVGYHAVQTLLFGFSCVLLFRLYLALNLGFACAWMGAMFFLSHPIHVESVTWLSGHKDVLSLCFLCAHLLAYARGRFVPSFLWFVLSVFSKYHVLVTPFLLPLVDLAAGRRISVPRWAMFVVAALLAFFLASLVGSVVDYGHIYLGTSATAVLRNLPVTLEIALSRLLAPVHLQLLYPFSAASSWLDPRVLRGCASFLLLSALFLGFLRKNPAVAFAAALVPVGLVPMFRAPEMHFLADRYLLIPSVGATLLLAWGLVQIRVRALRWGLAFILGLSFSVLTVTQNRVWRDDLALWMHSVRGERPVPKGVWERVAAATRDEKDWIRSEKASLELLRLMDRNDPSRADQMANLGFVRIQRGHMTEAETVLRKAVALNARSFQARMNLGIVLAMQGKSAEARIQFEAARTIDPANVNLLFNLGRLYVEMGNFTEARVLLGQVQRLAPTDPRLPTLDQALSGH